MDYDGRYTGPQIDKRLDLAGTAYQLPEGGIPKADLDSEVQASLEKAVEAVLYTTQVLSEEEKETARANIKAMGDWKDWGQNDLYIDISDSSFLKEPILVLAMPHGHTTAAALYSICQDVDSFLKVTLLYGSAVLLFSTGHDESGDFYLGIERNNSDYSILTLQLSGDDTPISTDAPLWDAPDPIEPITYATTKDLSDGLQYKQDTLVSGENIKTINGQDVLGVGDLVISSVQKVEVGDNEGVYIVIPFRSSGVHLDISGDRYELKAVIGSLLVTLGDIDEIHGKAFYSGTPYADILDSVRIMNDGEDNYLVIAVSNQVMYGDVNISYIGNDATARVLHNVDGWETIDTITPEIAYVKPSGGIPKTDLASAVQTALDKADTAEQAANKVTSLSSQSTDTEYPSAKCVFDSLGKYGVISQTQTWAQAADNSWSYTMSGQVYGLIPQAFIDLVTSAGATFNAISGYFELNGLTDISYEEMRAIYVLSNSFLSFRSDCSYAFYSYNKVNGKAVRTVFSPAGTRTGAAGMNWGWAFYNSDIEIIDFQFLPLANMSNAFRASLKLKGLKGCNISSVSNAAYLDNIFLSAHSLENLELFGLKINISIGDSPRLSKESLLYMINNEASTGPITITLHPTVYAKTQSGGDWYTEVSTALAAHTNISLASA